MFSIILSPSGLKVPPAAASGASAVAGTDVLDMPVDPNEPTYCLCHQVQGVCVRVYVCVSLCAYV